ncbi:peptidase, partial [bacterium]|nr:peptidase [bacterium]
YFQSDMDWMDLSGDLEVVIGPYEVYEDNLMGCKAAFESFICVVDHESSRQLAAIAEHTREMEAALPLSDRYRYGGRGDDSPIKVVNLLYSAGDAKAGVQTAAFNLPNDERVREAKGSKKVLLKNVMKAKFEKCWIPIVRQALSEKDLARVSFDAYFTHVLLHEISHGLGPGKIIKHSAETTVNRELKDLYPTIEECKADVLGMILCEYLIGRGVLPGELAETLHASNLGGMFRSIRFGIDEAHGGGVAIQLNYLLEKDAFRTDAKGRFCVNDRKISGAMKDLAAELLRIEAEGDYEGASAFAGKYRFINPAVQAVLDRLSDVPVDIRPVYPVEKDLDTEAE